MMHSESKPGSMKPFIGSISSLYVVLIGAIFLALLLYDVHGHYNELFQAEVRVMAANKAVVATCPDENEIQRYRFDQAVKELEEVEKEYEKLRALRSYFMTTTTTSSTSTTNTAVDSDSSFSMSSKCRKAKRYQSPSNDQLLNYAIHMTGDHFSCHICMIMLTWIISPKDILASINAALIIIGFIIMMVVILCCISCCKNKKQTNAKHEQDNQRYIQSSDPTASSSLTSLGSVLMEQFKSISDTLPLPDDDPLPPIPYPVIKSREMVYPPKTKGE